MAWFHPYWFMRWLAEMNMPQWCAAAASATASVVALKIANENRLASKADRAEKADRDRKVAKQSLSVAIQSLQALAELVHEKVAMREGQAKAFLAMVKSGQEYALAQGVSDKELLELAFSLHILVVGLEDRIEMKKAEGSAIPVEAAVRTSLDTIQATVEQARALAIDTRPDPVSS